jgi:hypothetical protein
MGASVLTLNSFVGKAEDRTHDLRDHLQLADTMPTARLPPLSDKAMVLGEGCGKGWVYTGRDVSES